MSSSKPNKTLRAFGKKFGTAKIAIMEKTGSKESSEPTELIEVRNKAETTRQGQKEVYKKLQRATKAEASASKEQLAVAAAFRDYGNSLATDGDHPQLAGMFLRLGDFQEYMEELRTRLDFLLNLRMAESLKDFIKGDLREARYEHQRYAGTRRAHDAAEERLSQISKSKSATPQAKQEATEDAARAKQNYEAAEYNVQNLLNDCQRVLDFDTLENCCDYLEAYNDFFTKGHTWLSEIMPRVEKYREGIYASRQAFAREKEQRQGDLDDSGRRQPRCFGANLDQILVRESAIFRAERQLPFVFEQCVAFITRPDIAKLEGIFRISGSKVKVDALRKQYEEGDLANASLPAPNDDSAHQVTGLLKMFLRELSEPLCTYPAFKKFIECTKYDQHEDRVAPLKDVIASLPAANQLCLKELIRMCSIIVANEATNLMTATNVAIVIAPNILYQQAGTEDPHSMRGNLEGAQGVIETMVLQYSALFENGDIKKRRATASMPRDDPRLLAASAAAAEKVRQSEAAAHAQDQASASAPAPTSPGVSPASPLPQQQGGGLMASGSREIPSLPVKPGYQKLPQFASDADASVLPTSGAPQAPSSPSPQPQASPTAAAGDNSPRGVAPLQRQESSGWARARPATRERQFAEGIE